jgi:hypothetical protein
MLYVCQSETTIDPPGVPSSGVYGAGVNSRSSVKPVTADGDGSTDAGGAADPGAEAAGVDAEGAAVPQADMTSAALASSPNRRFCI